MLAKRIVIGVGVSAVVLSGAGAVAFPASAAPEAKVTICHRTNSTKNPYVMITVARSSVDGFAGKGAGDHFHEHTGPIWDVSQPNGGDWGDIIPAIPGVHNGLNWSALGQAILSDGCNAKAVEDAKPGDKDGDGTPDTTDKDDDGDGIPDTQDPDEGGVPPTVPGVDPTTDPIVDPTDDPSDTDGDGIPNGTDPDDDGDGTPDTTDEDVDGDGTIEDRSNPDTDNDGTPDSTDPDDDGDGTPDISDPDSNGDGETETARQLIIHEPTLEDVGGAVPTFVIGTRAMTTNAGMDVAVAAHCAVLGARLKPAGDVKSTCKVTKKGAKTYLKVRGGQPTRVRVIWTSGAIAEYKGLRVIETFRVN